MNEVYLVYVIYQYDGYDNTEAYSTKEKAIDAADELVSEFKENGYETTDHFEDVTFKEVVFDNYFNRYDAIHTRLTDGNGEVEITIEKKTVH